MLLSPIINKVFFIEVDRIARLPIASWHDCLLGKLDSIKKIASFRDVETLEIIVNQMSLIAFYAGWEKEAREICKNFIAYYKKNIFEKKIGEHQLGILQPFINYIRLERLIGNVQGALHFLDFINPLSANGELFIFDNKFSYSRFSDASKRLMTFCFFEESVKSFLQLRQYKELSKFLDSYAFLAVRDQNALAIEARSISIYYDKGGSAAIDYLKSNLCLVKEKFIPGLLLKLSIFFYDGKQTEVAYSSLLEIYNFYFSSINTLGLPELRSCINLLILSQKFGILHMVIDMVEPLLDKFTSLNDELSQLELLLLVKDNERFKQIWKETLESTDYIFFRGKFLEEKKNPPYLQGIKSLLKFLG
jgi:hypothetical protein